MTNKIEKSLYNGEVLIVFYPDSHRYMNTKKREWLVSVTSITGQVDKSRILLIWNNNLIKKYLENVPLNNITRDVLELAIKEPDRVRDEAAKTGKKVHEYCEKYILHDMDNTLEVPNVVDYQENEEVFNGVLAFRKWVADNNVRFVASEQFLYSKKYNYVGTTDFLYTRQDEDHKIKHLGDFKTSKGIYIDQFIQMAGYEIAYEEETGEKLGYGTLLHLDKTTGEYNQYNTIPEFSDEAKSLFVILCNLKHNMKEAEKRFNQITKKEDDIKNI